MPLIYTGRNLNYVLFKESTAINNYINKFNSPA